MRKSDLDRQPYAGRRICQYESVMAEKCHDGATVALTITSYLTNPDKILTSTSLLCSEHADKTISNYTREWANHPEYFDRLS